MEFLLSCSSHSPLYYFPARQSDEFLSVKAALEEQRKTIESFDPELIIYFGTDHYGGQNMSSMPAFCVGVEATALSDVGGTRGELNVPRDQAVALVNALRRSDIDVAVSYAMTVDHGFSFTMSQLAGELGRYPTIPIFVNCIQPPFVPFRRARMLGEAVGALLKELPQQRVALFATGGLSHDPGFLFPSIDDVSEQWRPYILHGIAQSEVPRQSWIDYEIEAHVAGAAMVADEAIPLENLGIIPDWDAGFLEILAAGRFEEFDDWEPEAVVSRPGIGAMEILTWIAASAAMKAATGALPRTVAYHPCREIAVGFGVAQAGPCRLLSS